MVEQTATYIHSGQYSCKEVSGVDWFAVGLETYATSGVICARVIVADLCDNYVRLGLRRWLSYA